MTRLLVLPLLLAGCGRVPCGDVGRAISEQTLTCEGNAAIGHGRARALKYLGTCPNGEGWWDPWGVPARCVTAIEALECGEVRALGDDLDAWLATSAACDELVLTGASSSGGSGGGGGGDDTGTSSDDTGTGEETVPCSDPAGAPTALAVTNDSDTAVDLFWVAEDCSEVIQVTLALAESTEISTYVGHVFVARELRSPRAVVDWVQVSQADAESWSVTR